MLNGVILRQYQRKILNELADMPAIGLFMKAGSGKTLTSLERFMQNGTDNLLVVCPQKIVTQWWKVIESVLDISICQYSLSKSAEKKNDIINDYCKQDFIKRKCVVVNYDIIHKVDSIDKYINNNWTIILDESHKIKNMGTTRKPIKKTIRCLALGELTQYKIILTATPTEKRYGGYIDLYPQLKFLGYIDYDLTYFKNMFCIQKSIQIPGMPYPIKDIVGYKVREIEEHIITILQNTCRYYAPKYGDYEPEFIYVDIPKAQNYNKLIKERAYNDITFDNVSAMRIGKKTLISGKITGTNEYGDRLTYIDNTEKVDWLEEFLSNTDEVVSVLYCYNVEKDLIVDVCEKLNKSYIIINGDVVDKPKELEKECDVIIGQYSAFGESLDGVQYKCRLMVFYSLPDSSLYYRQSLGRIDRIGQKSVPTYYHLIMTGTLDEKMLDMLKNKIEYSERNLNSLQE